MYAEGGWTRPFETLDLDDGDPFVRAFQGPRGQTHTHKPRKGVCGRRSLDDGDRGPLRMGCSVSGFRFRALAARHTPTSPGEAAWEARTLRKGW